MVKRYVPSQGDIVFLQFSPQQGREQAGVRPAVVLSPASYNERVGLMLACPVTGQAKGYPFEVSLPAGMRTHGVVLSDHVKSLDWTMRKAKFVERVPRSTLLHILSRVELLLEPQ